MAENSDQLIGLSAPEHLRQGAANAQVQADPSKLFERRRRMLMIVMLILILGICGFLGYGISNPTKGMANIIAAPALRAGDPTPTAYGATSLFGSGPSGPAPIQPVQPQVTAAASLIPPVSSMMACRASARSVINGVEIPEKSLVQVSGFSYAKNGQVYLSDPNLGWADAVFFNCPPEIVRLERTYVVLPVGTPTKCAGAPGPVVYRTVVVQQTVVAQATAVPAPGGYNAIFYDSGSGCATFELSGVKSIYADGRPVSGGDRVCGASNFSVTLK